MVDSSMPVNYAASDHPSDVEARLRRLEASVTALQDTQLMEDRVAERVVGKLRKSPMRSLRDSASVIVDAGKMLLPLKSENSGRMPKPDDTVDPPTADAPTAPPADKPGWLIFDLWNELTTFGRMIFDHRYPFSYAGRFGPVIIATAYFFSWLFLAGSIVGGTLDRILAIALAFMLYKIMSREVQRYRAMFPR